MKKISPPHRGLWVYKPTWIGSETSVRAFRDHLVANDINEVYLSCNLATLGSDDLPGFIGHMSGSCVTVEALIGKPTWATSAGRLDMLSQLDKLIAYNAAHDAESQFSAVHLDIEPWIGTGTSLSWVKPLIESYSVARQRIAGASLALSVDMAGAKIQNASLAQRQALVKSCDSLLIMQYEASLDNAVSRTRKFAADLDFGDCGALVALRGEDFPHVRDTMDGVLAQLRAESWFTGWAIFEGHHAF